ncbi:class I SAM-dependent methyltransferase [Streptomyces sp. ISL-22]|uniref:class I SAM-dependent methyltransferase n=1 Tax=Streptomyces sp. ISL-24 TaxID=2819181 RepID=UPI001BE6C893|nr:class I SAM-dependent methyltransferase [Streptomyces sp. ISL-24]MBT2421919.1 class I SAM-dependent methyltransferase [Streptomyces sp. ISL-24]MBT2433469.1 class I SAM-dependent methyltransferase [Streptomyces sp. ISL-22]
MTAEDWDRWAASGAPVAVSLAEVEHFEQVVAPKRGMTAVDLTCGTGQWTRQLAAWGMTVAGYDYANESLRQAESGAAHAGLSYALWDIVAEPIPTDLVPGQIDVVTCRYGLLYLEPGRLLTDIGRWLKPAGVFYALVRVGGTRARRCPTDPRVDSAARLDHLSFDAELPEESITRIGAGWARREVHPTGASDRAIVLSGYDPPPDEHFVLGEPDSRAYRALVRQPTAAHTTNQIVRSEGHAARPPEMP